MLTHAMNLFGGEPTHGNVIHFKCDKCVHNVFIEIQSQHMRFNAVASLHHKLSFMLIALKTYKSR